MEKFTVYEAPSFKDAKYVISGPDCQILTIHLNAKEKIESEPGSLMYMSSGTDTELHCGSISRCCTGERICFTSFVNNANQPGYVALTPSFPAKIIPIDMTTVGGKIYSRKGAYMSSLNDVEVTCECSPFSRASLCGGLGCIRQLISGKGTAFLASGGTVVYRNLSANEKLIVDTDSIVAYQESLKFDIKFAGNLCSLCFGGEGMFNTSVEGPGLLILQSMSFDKFKQAVRPNYTPNDNDGVEDEKANQ